MHSRIHKYGEVQEKALRFLQKIKPKQYITSIDLAEHLHVTARYALLKLTDLQYMGLLKSTFFSVPRATPKRGFWKTSKFKLLSKKLLTDGRRKERNRKSPD